MRSCDNPRQRGVKRGLLALCAMCQLWGCATPAASVVKPQVRCEPATRAAATFQHEEVEVHFTSGEDELVGTLSVPQGQRGPMAGVLLLQDAGPMDRDATQTGELGVRWAQPVTPHRELADALAARGLVVLRYDKRTCVPGQGRCAYPRQLARDAALLEADAAAALKALASRPEVDPTRLGVVGHGEGAELALLVGEEARGVRVLALLAPSPYPVDALIQHQHAASVRRLEQQLAREGDSARADLWRQHMEALKRAQGEEARLAELRGGGEGEVFGIEASSWRAQWSRHERAMERLGSAPPLVAVFGDRDEVLPMEAARAFAQRVPAGVRGREIRVLTGVTHGMIDATRGDGLGADVRASVVDALMRRLADGSSDNNLTH